MIRILIAGLVCWGLAQAQTRPAGWVNVADFGALGDGANDDAPAIQTAINTVVAAGGGVVFLPAGIFRIAAGLVIDGSNVAIQGTGKGATTISGGISFGWSISAPSATPKTNIEVRDLTVDMTKVAAASGIYAQYVTGFAVRRCALLNIAAKGWGVHVGSRTENDTTIRNFDIAVEDSNFDNIDGTLEHLLVFNSARVRISRCNFSNGPTAPAIGLYQFLDDVTVSDSVFDNMANGVYYSLSTDNLVFQNLTTTASVNTGIRGANVSDHGTFGLSNVRNVKVIGGTYSAKGVGVFLGAVNGASVIGARFYRCGTAGLVIDAGRDFSNGQPLGNPSNIVVSGSQFIENNQSAVVPLLNPGLFINASAQNVLISGNVFADDQVTPTQLYPITVNGTNVATNVVITGNRLSAYGAGVSVQTVGGARLANSLAFANTDYKASAAIGAGISAVKTIKGSDGANCALTLTNGVVTATTCP